MKFINYLITIITVFSLISINTISAQSDSITINYNKKNGIIYYVDDEPGTGLNNPPEDFTSIQKAINATNNGDTIYVYNGTYKEFIVIYKSIDIIGENKYFTIIDAEYKDDTIWIVAPNVTVTGFTIMKSLNDGFHGGIHIRCKFVQINDCIIRDNDCGIRVQDTSNASIDNCIIFNNDAHSIYVIRSSDILIQYCDIFNNGNTVGYPGGIMINTYEGDSLRSNICIQYCNIHNNVISGISISNDHNDDIGYGNMLIQNNQIHNHSEKGIFISECEVSIINNTIYRNGAKGSSMDAGITLQDVNELVTIKNNVISNNKIDGIYFLRSVNNIIQNNDFINNERQISFTYQKTIWSSNKLHNNYYDDLRNPWMKIFFGWYIHPEKLIIIPFMINIERNPSTTPNNT